MSTNTAETVETTEPVATNPVDEVLSQLNFDSEETAEMREDVVRLTTRRDKLDEEIRALNVKLDAASKDNESRREKIVKKVQKLLNILSNQKAVVDATAAEFKLEVIEDKAERKSHKLEDEQKVAILTAINESGPEGTTMKALLTKFPEMDKQGVQGHVRALAMANKIEVRGKTLGRTYHPMV